MPMGWARRVLATHPAAVLACARIMFEVLKPWLLLIVVVLGSLVAPSWSVGPRWAKTLAAKRPWSNRHWERAHRLMMAVCTCLGVWTFTFFGEFHDHGAFGHVNFHPHDCYHYYFGSKYLHESGYVG